MSAASAPNLPSWLRERAGGGLEFDLEAPMPGNAGFGVNVAQLRPPSGRAVLRFDDPTAVIVGSGPNGQQAMPVVSMEAVRGYGEDCLENMAWAVFEARATQFDALRIKAAILHFFRHGADGPPSSPAGSTSASTSSAGSPISS